MNTICSLTISKYDVNITLLPRCPWSTGLSIRNNFPSDVRNGPNPQPGICSE